MSINKSALNTSILNRGNFSIVPNEIWTLPISPKAKLIYIYLISQSEKWNPGVREISKGSSIGIDSVRTALKELESVAMISITESPQGLRNIYELKATEEWAFTTSVRKDAQPQANVRTPLCVKTHTTVRKDAHTQEEPNTNQIRSNTSSKAEAFEIGEIGEIGKFPEDEDEYLMSLMKESEMKLFGKNFK